MSQAEKIGVENPAIASLVKLGYKHLSGKTIKPEPRHLAPIMLDVLQTRLLVLNPWLADTAGGVAAAVVELKKRVNDELIPANRAFWEQVVHRRDIQVKDAQGFMKSVRFFDTTDATNNDFHVVDQFVGANADGDAFRPDLLLFVNGLPLAMIECKASHHRMEEALGQLDGYQRSFAPQFVFNQVLVGLNRREGRYAAIATKPDYYARYRLQEAERQQVIAVLGDEPSEQDELLWALFEPSRFLELITHLVLFEVRDGKVMKKLPRYQQWRAIRKTVARLTAVKPVAGVVWHTQGSGKSLTMALLARYLRSDSLGLNNPTVLVLTDRKDLDQQIFETFCAIGIKTMKAGSVDGLIKILSNDYGSVLTSTVHKFQEQDDQAESDGPDTPEVADEADDGDTLKPNEQAARHVRIRVDNDFYIVEQTNAHFGKVDADGVLLKAKWVEVAREKINFRVLSNKANFYVLVDEAHRSQYDFLAAFMRASVPNAKFVAFTGTPLLQDDKHTLGEFGGGEYIDEYRLHEAVADGATLPIKYLDAWIELVASIGLDEAFKAMFAEESEAKKAALKKELLRQWRAAAGRLEKVAEHLTEHFLANVQAKGLKAMLVCDGRDMAVAYKDLLDAKMMERAKAGLPTFESRVVISLAGITSKRTGHTEAEEAEKRGVDVAEIASIEERIKAEIKAKTTPVAILPDEISTFVSKLFPLPFGDESKGRDGQIHANNIGLIIVSDMLLTGWDAPIVGTMYLDKPLKEHTLLQAIARVNRTLAGKNAGYIVDYHGVVEHLDHALKIYGGEVKPSQVWEGVESEIPKAQATLERILKLLPRKHDPVTQREDYKDDAEQYLDPDTRLDSVEEFIALVKQFNRSLDIILPDVRGIPFKPYFTLFGEIRLMLRDKLPSNAYQERITKLESALLQQLLDEYIASSPAKSLLGHEVSILDASDMARLKRGANAGSQALTMKNQLKHTIVTGRDKDPAFFDKLAEELAKLLLEEKAGRITQVQFLEQLELFGQQIRDKDKSGFANAAQTAAYHYLAKELTGDVAKVITTKVFEHVELSNTLAAHNWKQMRDVHPEVRDLLRRLLMPLAGWERTVAREHANQLFDILLKN